ncbi:hypothetical protein LTR56_006241 [Elasticomyces elasticus]|nr:hypothetical protein LTR56_006241 [Elasticomyces elasticus]KAK4928317.1 hypothetical protein LTR49_004994 [Elasticomyces elasticus]KAK5763880.1 hypothetical protein LTS12_005998 [Elasticomyces elasticus]
MIYALNISLGYMITEWIGLGLFFVKGNASWRILFGLQLVPTAIMLIPSFWMPFSPRWLIMKDRQDEARIVLEKLHSHMKDDETFHQREFNQIQAQIHLDNEEGRGFKDLFLTPSYRKRVFLVVFACVSGQMTGIIPLQNYQVFIYQICGFGGLMSLILTAVWGTTTCLAVLFMSPWIDRIGRRKSVFLAYGFIIPGSLIIIVTWARFDASDRTNLGVAKAIIFGMFFMLWGYAGILNTFVPCYSSEIMPTCVRAAGVACGYAAFNIIVILLVQVTPLALENVSWRYFLAFLIWDFIAVVVYYFFYPETKNATLEEIEAIFGDRVAVSLDDACSSHSAVHEKVNVEQVEKTLA